MRVLGRVTCRLVGHRRRGERVTYDAGEQEFVDVAPTKYAVCERCGEIRPSRVEVVNRPSESTGDD